MERKEQKAGQVTENQAAVGKRAMEQPAEDQDLDFSAQPDGRKQAELSEQKDTIGWSETKDWAEISNQMKDERRRSARKQLSIRTKRILVVLSLLAIVGILAVVAVQIAPALVSIVEDPEGFRAWVNSNKMLSRLVMIGLMALKVIVPVIPGKPFEIGAGYAFGAFEGAILCLIGAALGSYIVFFIVRTVGVKAFNVFYPREKLLSLSFLKDTKRLSVWVFFIMLIPGTPKDFFSYFVGLTDMKFRSWLIISPLARVPVIIMSTVGGDALGVQDYWFAAIIFMITVAISVAGLLTYNWLEKKKSTENS